MLSRWPRDWATLRPSRYLNDGKIRHTITQTQQRAEIAAKVETMSTGIYVGGLMMQRTRAALSSGAVLVAIYMGAYSEVLLAQNFPSRPLRLIVGQAPATGTDIVARAVAGKWSEYLGQPVIVDNRPGAGESIAAGMVANATSDGYTILFGSIASHGIAPAVYKKLPYDPARDFAPISMVGTTPNVLVVHLRLPVRGIGEFAAYIKTNPGRFNYGSTGVGTSTHLGMELLKTRMGINIVHVPYKSGSAAFTDIIGGQVAAGLFNLPSQLPLIKAEKVRALGVSSLKRNVQLPDVPTIDESGAPGYEVVVWYAMFAPAGTPRTIHARIHADLVKALNSSELRERMVGQLGVDPITSTPDQLAQYSGTEIKKWAKVAQEASVKVE
jgi:tripartite-type tricarboxylate transporter receptor subunit TctC